jgi:hypothetical protein
MLDLVKSISSLVQGDSDTESITEVVEEEVELEVVAGSASPLLPVTQASRALVNSSWSGILSSLGQLLRVSSSSATNEAILR